MYPTADLPESQDVNGGAIREIYSVSRLTHETRLLIENGFPLLWIEGEISNLARPASGHLYFSLKDARSQVRCALFRSRARLVRTTLANGMQVLLRARVSLYEGRGEFQLLVESVEPAGEGRLLLELERLKRELAAAGLFDAEHKRPLPPLPRHIAVVTSASGAAIADVLTTLARRYPLGRVTVLPVTVQGAESAGQVIRALDLAPRAGCDLILLVRGGGSLEDLWSFNDPRLVQAIHDCPVPVVTGIGHEVDTTLADLAADVRGATPTAAAELATPNITELHDRLVKELRGLTRAVSRSLHDVAQRLDWCSRRLLELRQLQNQIALRPTTLAQRLVRSWQGNDHRWRARLKLSQQRLRLLSPLERQRAARQRLTTAAENLQRAMTGRHLSSHARFAQATARLQLLSPLATLERGYTITLSNDGKLLRSVHESRPRDRIRTLLADGTLWSQVTASEPNEPAWLHGHPSMPEKQRTTDTQDPGRGSNDDQGSRKG